MDNTSTETLLDRRTNLLKNANTHDYNESYLKTQEYDHLRVLNNIQFEPYILGINKVLESFSNRIVNRYTASPEQARVIYSMAKRIGIIASAGSGKTTTILYKLRINSVILGWKESDVLAITYTNEAAKNMRDSYKRMVQDQVNPTLINFKTIHKFGKEFIEIANPRMQLITEDKPLEEYYYDFELEENVKQETSMYDLLRRAINQNGLEHIKVKLSDVVSALAVISEKMITSQEQFKDSEQFLDMPLTFEQLMQIKQTYLADKISKNCMDYVDMLETIHTVLSSIQSLEQIQDIRLRNHLTYKAIYLDEAQDVSPIQISLINNLLRLNPDCQLVVVGDDDQSIFNFRGASPEYLVNLEKYYPVENGKEPLELIYMTYNRRSAPLIVNTMNKVIENNKKRYDKVAKAFNDHLDGHIEVIRDVRNSIAKSVILMKAKELYGKHQSAKNMAVLYREHSQVAPIVNMFVKERIPFNIGDELNKSLFIHNHFLVKDLLGIMQMTMDLSSPYLIEQYLHKLCPYVGTKVSKEIAYELSQQQSLPLSERKKLSQIIKEKGKNDANKIILECYNAIKQSDTKKDNLELIELFYSKYRTAYLDWYLSKNPNETDDCMVALDYLMSKDRIGYQGLKNSVLDDRSWTASHYNYALGVKLRTFHTSKGLEWEHVYLLPISNRVSPKESVLAQLSKEGGEEYVEEERRLFYVACTRAIKNLTVFYNEDGEHDKNIFIEELKIGLQQTKEELKN